MQEVFAMFICHDGICSISFYWALRCKRSSVEIAFPSVRPSVRPSVYCLSVTCLAVSKRRIFFYRICLLYLIGQESCSVVKKARKYLQSLFQFFCISTWYYIYLYSPYNWQKKIEKKQQHTGIASWLFWLLRLINTLSYLLTYLRHFSVLRAVWRLRPDDGLHQRRIHDIVYVRVHLQALRVSYQSQ